MFWDLVLKRTVVRTRAAIELMRPSGEFTSEPEDVAGIFAENYEKLGRDAPPPGHTFTQNKRDQQDARVAEILRMSPCRGQLGADVTAGEVKGLCQRSVSLGSRVERYSAGRFRLGIIRDALTANICASRCSLTFRQ